MQRLTHFVQGHQRVFLELKQPDVQQAFLRAMREVNKNAAGAAAAGTTSRHADVAQGVQRDIHIGRKYPTFGNESFGPAYETWSDDMACILQGSCSPGSTRYCRTLSMFGKMELRDIMQASSSDGLPNGGRGYHTSTMPLWSLNAQSKLGLPLAQVWDSKSYATDSPTSPTEPEGQVSQRQRLKMAVRDYGSTVVVFHVCISLISLGGFYLAVSRWITALISNQGWAQLHSYDIPYYIPEWQPGFDHGINFHDIAMSILAKQDYCTVLLNVD